MPANNRVLGQSVFGAAASLGILVVMLLSERLASVGGWRGAFIIEGIFILGYGWYVGLNLAGSGQHKPAAAVSRRRALGQGIFYVLGIAHVITYGIFIGVTSWIVTFLFRDFGIGLEWAGPLSALLTLGAIVGRLVGGMFSRGREHTVIIVSCVVSTVSVGLLPLVPSLATALLVALVFGWFVSVPFGAIFSYSSLTSGRPASGREISVINFVANTGALAFPPLVGLALDFTGSFVVGFGVLAAIGAVGCGTLMLLLPKPRRSS